MSSLSAVNGQVPSGQTPKDPEQPPAHSATDVAHDAGINTSTGETPSPNAESARHHSGTASQLRPIPALQTKRKVDLTRAVLPNQGAAQAVESLTVHVLKGVGDTFTADLSAMLVFFSIVFEPRGTYEKLYQIVTGPLLDDPRVMRHARRTAFVPAFSYSTFEVVLLPVKMSNHGLRVLDKLRKLQPQFPGYKASVIWDHDCKRHVVDCYPLTALEQSAITSARWPSQNEVLEALGDIAYDHIDDLAKANDDIQLLQESREVE